MRHCKRITVTRADTISDVLAILASIWAALAPTVEDVKGEKS
jgi:hypothetical protein